MALFFWACGDDPEPDPGDNNASPNNASQCDGPDPSLDCRDTGCETDQECVVEEGGCLASACSCIEGDWLCTADCGEKYHCVDEASDTCEEPDPSLDCRDTGCEQGECLPDDGCLPSSCECQDGGWICTDDCGELYTCQEPLSCLTPDPSVDCQTTGCADGLACEPLPADDPNACKPSSCQCTDDGNWACTRDCQERHACVEATCEGPNPAGCTQEGCPDGERCRVDPETCEPSTCGCSGGDWICTADCGGGGTCVPEDDFCKEANPAGCSQEGCPDGERCLRKPGECAPSQCFCSEDGDWLCTKDCGGGGTCVDSSTTMCEGENPAATPCGAEDSCPVGQECVDAPECVPSTCGCNNGLWICTTDCVARICVVEK